MKFDDRFVWRLVAIWICSAGGISAAQPVAADFAANDFISNPQLSPDGTRFAGLVTRGDRTFLIIAPVRTAGNEPLLLNPDDDVEIVDWEWVNADWLVVSTVEKTLIYSSPVKLGRTFSVDGRTGRIRQIGTDRRGQDDARLIWVARDGSPRVLVSVRNTLFLCKDGFYPEVFEIDVSTGRRRSAAGPTAGILNWYADANGVVRIGVGYNFNLSTSKLLYRARAGEFFRDLEHVQLLKDERLPQPVHIPVDGTKAIAIAEHEGFRALYELDLADISLGSKLFGVNGYDIQGPVFGNDGADLIGVRAIDVRSRTHWLNPELEAVQLALDKALERSSRRAELVSRSRDSQRMIVYASSPSSPGSYYFFDRQSGALDLLGHVNRGLGETPLNPVSTFRYTTRDGLPVLAVLTLPASREARSLPLLVMPHGGPAVRDYERWDWWAQYAAQLGYAVVQPNYRGSAGFGKSFREASTGQWGLAMQDDLIDAIAHLAGRGTIDAKRVCIAGGSYGGYAALRAAQRDGEHYRCALSFAGVSDLGALAAYDSNALLGDVQVQALQRQAPDFAKVSPVNFPEQFSIPVLLVHGARDLRVPVEHSREMALKLRKAGKPVEYVEQPLGDHYFSRPEDRLSFLLAMERFLLEHNPP